MRWAYKENETRRVRRSFLILPRYINGEARWLERAAWIEERDIGNYAGGEWRPVRWADGVAA